MIYMLNKRLLPAFDLIFNFLEMEYQIAVSYAQLLDKNHASGLEDIESFEIFASIQTL